MIEPKAFVVVPQTDASLCSPFNEHGHFAAQYQLIDRSVQYPVEGNCIFVSYDSNIYFFFRKSR